MLADLPSSREPVLLESLDGRAEQKPIPSIATGSHFGDRLDEAAAGGGNPRERISLEQLSKTYAHLLPDSADRARVALDAYLNERGEEAEAEG